MILLTALAAAETLTFAPGEAWCAAAKAAQPGDTVVLQAGDHAGPCVLSAGGAEGAPVTVRGEEGADPPRIVYAGASSNVIDVTASWVTVSGLAFGPTEADIDAIKVKAGDHVTVERNTFTHVGGIGVSANSADTVGLTIRGNRFVDMDATAIYLGCHDGAGACTATDVLVADNLIDGVTSDAVGYGLELKRDSTGVIRDNVVNDTQGPGIEVFGSEDPARGVLVTGNLVAGSRRNGSVEVGGPNVTVTNNVIVGGAAGALYVYPYWDSVHDVIVAGNTLWGDADRAVRFDDAVTDSVLVGNVAYQADGASPFPAASAEITAEADVTCTTPEACWVDGAAWDFTPAAGGALAGAGVTRAELAVDFCGVTRADPPTVGAIEADAGGPGPLTVALKSTFDCAPGGDPGDSGDSGDSGGADLDDGASAAGCACDHAGGASPIGVMLAWGFGGIVLAARRRRARLSA